MTEMLIVDDDADIRDALLELLQSEGFRPVGAATGTEGLQRAAQDNPQLIVLDVNLPDISGRDVCRRLRLAGVRVPIIMLTAAGEEADIIQGLTEGADDYVTKPFNSRVLLARLRMHLIRHLRSGDCTVQLGDLEFRPSERVLIDPDGKKQRLTEKEVQILRYLWLARSRSVSRAELLDRVWGYNSGVRSHTLETHIYRLRQKLEVSPAAPGMLVTTAGGYRLITEAAPSLVTPEAQPFPALAAQPRRAAAQPPAYL